MGAPKPWPTRWPEPELIPLYGDDDYYEEPFGDPDYDITVTPSEAPSRLPEEMLYPRSVTWGVTQFCNLRCNHCYDAVDHKRGDLTTNQALKVIDRLAEIGISLIAFSGGEPTLRRDLPHLLKHCCNMGIDIALRSNATQITREVAHRLADMGVQVVGVSLDGATESTHNLVRGQGAYQKTRAGIQALLSEGIRVNIEVVLRKQNAHQSLQFVTLAENWEVDEVNFAAIVPQGRAMQLQGELLSPATWEEITAQLYRASKTAKVVVSPSCTLLGNCYACIEPNITCDGWVTPCYLSKHKLFHVLKTDAAEVKASLRQHRLFTMNACKRMQKSHVTQTLAVSLDHNSCHPSARETCDLRTEW